MNPYRFDGPTNPYGSGWRIEGRVASESSFNSVNENVCYDRSTDGGRERAESSPGASVGVAEEAVKM